MKKKKSLDLRRSSISFNASLLTFNLLHVTPLRNHIKHYITLFSSLPIMKRCCAFKCLYRVTAILFHFQYRKKITDHQGITETHPIWNATYNISTNQQEIHVFHLRVHVGQFTLCTVREESELPRKSYPCFANAWK
jgi:hypothetical protein